MKLAIGDLVVYVASSYYALTKGNKYLVVGLDPYSDEPFILDDNGKPNYIGPRWNGGEPLQNRFTGEITTYFRKI